MKISFSFFSFSIFKGGQDVSYNLSFSRRRYLYTPFDKICNTFDKEV